MCMPLETALLWLPPCPVKCDYDKERELKKRYDDEKAKANHAHYEARRARLGRAPAFPWGQGTPEEDAVLLEALAAAHASYVEAMTTLRLGLTPT